MSTEITQQTATKLQSSQLDLILLDASSSMSGKWESTTRALDEYLGTLKQSNLNSRLLLCRFSSPDGTTICRDGELSQVAPLSHEPLAGPCGGTPLYDSIATIAWKLRDLDPRRATVLIVTDGQEAGSQVTTLDQAKSLISWMRAKGWQVIFMGCDFNNTRQAGELGANADTAIGVSKHLLKDAAKLLAAKRQAYGLYGTEIHFSGSEQQQFGGLLPPPPK